MVETLNSVLLVDFDSIYTNLQRRDLGAGDLLATRSAAWLGAIDSGELISPNDTVPRRVMVKRCYADPKLLSKGRSWMSAKGVQIVDCPPAQGRDNNAANVHMVLDALDSLEHASGYDEFILMTADADLSPLLFRLRAYNRRTVIYAGQGTSSAYRSYADAVIEESALLSLLRSGRAGGPTELDTTGVDFSAKGPVDKDALSNLARRINQAAKVPLFSTKVYNDLFRLVVLEVAENGYRFQSTAENVASRMSGIGRNVTRRQVGFVVKGLTLRGHVFSSTDSVEELAAVFYQQVLFLARNSRLNLTKDEEHMVGVWITGRGTVALPPPEAKPVEAVVEEEPIEEMPPVAEEPIEEVPIPEPVPIPTRRPQRPPMPAQPQAQTRRVPQQPIPMPQRPPRQQPPAAQQPVAAESETPQRSNRPARPQRPAAAARAGQGQSAGSARLSRFAQRMKQASNPPPDEWEEEAASIPEEVPDEAPEAFEPEPELEDAPPPPPRRRQRPAGRPRQDQGEMENSILAAIAEAVDVMVDDDSTDRPPPRRPRQLAAPTPPPQPEADDEGDEIGDEIQRILAGYNRDRGRR